MKKVLIGLGILFLLLLVSILRPVPILPESECKSVSGILKKVWEGPSFDLVFMLENDARTYYINRGAERGLDADQLSQELQGKEITLKYPQHWTPLDPFNSSIHVSKLSKGQQVYFDETPKD